MKQCIAKECSLKMHSVPERDKLPTRSTQKYLGPARLAPIQKEGRTGPGRAFPLTSEGTYTLPYLSDSVIRLGASGAICAFGTVHSCVRA